jgi:predicted DNA-binding transcriptional regulator AlpA
MLTVDQLVEMLQLRSKETIYYWNKMGTGPTYYRVGRYIRYNKIDVLQWLEKQQDDLRW